MSTIFFTFMGISLMLELSQFIWYLISPTDPRSNNMAYDFVKFFHVIAVSGFTFCMGIPICVWAGMITGSEINILELSYTTASKTVLHFTIALTMINTVVAIFQYFLGYEDLWYLYIAATLSQALISLTWLCVGISLQRIVANTSVGSSFNIVFSLNVIIFLVFLCDLTRAVLLLVFDFMVDMPSDWEFSWFLIGSVLVPFCIGNFLLIRLMTMSLKHEDRIENKLLKTRVNSATDGLRLALAPDSMSDYSEVPDDES
jgi:hypothetical protein